jgi:hypothetical protein
MAHTFCTFPHDVQEQNMVCYLAIISDRHFCTGQIARNGKTHDTSRRTCENFTSCDGNTLDFVRSIFAEIHNLESREIAVWNAFTVCHADDSNLNNKHGSYLLISGGQSEQVLHIVTSIKKQVKRLSTDPGWNPRRCVIVTMIKTCCMCDILEAFTKNCGRTLIPKSCQCHYFAKQVGDIFTDTF